MFKRILICFFLPLFLLSCAGSGVTSYSQIAPMVSNKDGLNVFILRDSGYVGGGALIDVVLNNSPMQLGNKEMIVWVAIEGNNTLTAKVSGIQGTGLNVSTKEFKMSKKQNRFYIISFKTGLFSNELQLMETVEDEWKQAASK